MFKGNFLLNFIVLLIFQMYSKFYLTLYEWNWTLLQTSFLNSSYLFRIYNVHKVWDRIIKAALFQPIDWFIESVSLHCSQHHMHFRIILYLIQCFLCVLLCYYVFNFPIAFWNSQQQNLSWFTTQIMLAYFYVSLIHFNKC